MLDSTNLPLAVTSLTREIHAAPASISLCTTPSLRRVGRDSGVTNSPQSFCPGIRFSSTSTTRAPSFARLIAAEQPAGPAPTTVTSYSSKIDPRHEIELLLGDQKQPVWEQPPHADAFEPSSP